MRHRKLWITGGIAVAGGALFRVLRHRKQPDPADELRRKLDELEPDLGGKFLHSTARGYSLGPIV